MRGYVIKHGCTPRSDHAINLAFSKRRFRRGEDDQSDQMLPNKMMRLRRRRQPGLCESADVAASELRCLLRMRIAHLVTASRLSKRDCAAVLDLDQRQAMLGKTAAEPNVTAPHGTKNNVEDDSAVADDRFRS
jgi:hypothetical protein